MFRQYDFECSRCERVHTELVDVPSGEDPPMTVIEYCDPCGDETAHDRLRVNMIAKLLSDRPFSPMVQGGNFDTAGSKALPPLPDFNGESGRDFKDHSQTKDFKEAKAERKNIAQQNKAKKERARLIKSGANIDIRHHPLPGDPKVMQ